MSRPYFYRRYSPFCHYLRRLGRLLAGVTTVLVIIVLRPFVLIRIGPIISSRIGHLALNTEILLQYTKLANSILRQHTHDVYFPERYIANKYFLRIISKNLCITESWLLRAAYSVLIRIPYCQQHVIPEKLYWDRDILGLLPLTHTPNTPSLEDQIHCWQLLENINISKSSKVALFIVRESTYLQQHQPWVDSSNHSYRDIPLSDYVPAMEALAEKGYVVLRMGHPSPQELDTQNPSIIDYANHTIRCEMLDVFLAYVCELCVSSGTGYEALPYIYNKPILLTNIVPINHLYTSNPNIIATLRTYYSIKECRKLSHSEVNSRKIGNLLSTTDYEREEIMLLNNSPEEIVNAVLDMHDHINNTLFQSDEDQKNQLSFWELFDYKSRSNANNMVLHADIACRISPSFLRNNKEWLH